MWISDNLIAELKYGQAYLHEQVGHFVDDIFMKGPQFLHNFLHNLEALGHKLVVFL